MKRAYLIILTLACFTTITLAQEACSALVEKALEAADAACLDTGRNEACYGNNLIELTPQANVRVESFNVPGDRITLSAVQSLKLNPLDEEAGTWGVALLRLQANLPDTLPGQNVTFLLFGDVQIENAVESGDTSMTPMQAFYFTTGVGDAACEEAPESGLMIQTPVGAGEIVLNANGANITLGSTAFLQAYDKEDGSPEMAFSVLEGLGSIESGGIIQPIPAGSWIKMALNAERRAEFVPPRPIPYRENKFERFPLRLLERRIEVSNLTQEEIDAVLDNLSRVRTGEMVILSVRNPLRSDVTVTIAGQTYVIPSRGVERIPLEPNVYTAEVCIEGECVYRTGNIFENQVRVISPLTFNRSADE